MTCTEPNLKNTLLIPSFPYSSHLTIFLRNKMLKEFKINKNGSLFCLQELSCIVFRLNTSGYCIKPS